MIGCTTQITTDAQLQQKLGTQFNGRRLWPLHVRCRRKTLTFAISSSDELLLITALKYKISGVWNFKTRQNLGAIYISVPTPNSGGLITYVARDLRHVYRGGVLTFSECFLVRCSTSFQAASCALHKMRAIVTDGVAWSVCVSVSVGHAREPCKKRLNRSRYRLGLTRMGPRHHVLDGVKVGRTHSPSRGVTRWRCGFSSEFFDHCF